MEKPLGVILYSNRKRVLGSRDVRTDRGGRQQSPHFHRQLHDWELEIV